jgi:dienelactone hydrolase
MAIVGAGDYRPDIHVYPGAVHGFDLPDRIYGGPIAYNAAAATDSERRVKDFLARHLR